MQAVREIYREQCSSNEPHDGGGHGGHTSRSLMQALGSSQEMAVALPRDVRKTCTSYQKLTGLTYHKCNPAVPIAGLINSNMPGLCHTLDPLYISHLMQLKDRPLVLILLCISVSKHTLMRT